MGIPWWVIPESIALAVFTYFALRGVIAGYWEWTYGEHRWPLFPAIALPVLGFCVFIWYTTFA